MNVPPQGKGGLQDWESLGIVSMLTALIEIFDL